MPEGDTVFRTAARLHEALAGTVLLRAELRWPSLAGLDLAGAHTVAVVARGKHLLHRLDTGLTLHSHLRMEGQWRIEDTATLPPALLRNPQVRAVLVAPRWTAVGLRLGLLHVVPTRDELTLVGHLGPDLLGPDWQPEVAVARVRASGTSIGAALLDQRQLAGIGTMYAAEALFLEALGPWTPVDTLDEAAVHRVVSRARRLLQLGCSSAVQSTTGSRTPGETTYVHARSGRPCRRCGELVRVAPIGPPGHQRTMFYCPRCQGGLGSTDDGRPQRPLGSGSGRGGASYRGR